MSPRQILLIIRVRWLLVVLVTLAIVITTGVVSMLLPKQYVSETTLLLDVKADPLVATFMPAVAAPAYMATQMEIIRSDRVSERVVEALGLDTNPQALAQWRKATKGQVPVGTFYGAMLQRSIVVEPVRGSNILSITATANNPKFAAAVANTFAKTYLDLSVALRVEPAKQYVSFFDDQLKSLRSQYEAAQASLSAYQQKTGIVVSDERLDQETARLNGLMLQLSTAQGEQAETSSRQRNTGSDTSPDVQQSPVVQSLRGELATAEAKLSEISSTVGINHPQRLQLVAQITEIKQQIAAESRRVSGTTATVSRQSSQKVGELQAMIETQKKAVLALRAKHDEITVLQRDVETAQRAFEAVAQRRSQVSLESQSDQAGGRVLSTAEEPIYASKPKVTVNVAASLVVGLLAAIGLAVAVEKLDSRVRSEADLIVADEIPVLAVLAPGRAVRWSGRYALPGGASPTMPPRLSFDGKQGPVSG